MVSITPIDFNRIECNPDYLDWNDNRTGYGIGKNCEQYKTEGWCDSEGNKGSYWLQNNIDHQVWRS